MAASPGDLVDFDSARRRVYTTSHTLTADQTADLERQITSSSRWIDSVTDGSATVAQPIAALDNNTDTTVLACADVSQLLDVRLGSLVSVGTDADPFALAVNRMVLAVGFEAVTVTISGGVLSSTSGTHSLFRGRWADTASVPADIQEAALEHIRWQHAVEIARNTDEYGAAGETISMPRRILDQLGDHYIPGVA